MAAAKFEIIRKANGSIKNLHGKISQKKQLNITVLNNQAYLHISDMKFAFKDNGKFNKNHIKQVSMSMSEVDLLKHYLLNLDDQLPEFLAQEEVEQRKVDKMVQQQQQALDMGQDYQNHQQPPQQQPQTAVNADIQMVQGDYQNQPHAIYQAAADMPMVPQAVDYQNHQQPQATSIYHRQPQMPQESVFQWAPYQHLAPQQKHYSPSWSVHAQQEAAQQVPQHIPVMQGPSVPWVSAASQQWDQAGQYMGGELDQHMY